jgi:hypothetical protein
MHGEHPPCDQAAHPAQGTCATSGQLLGHLGRADRVSRWPAYFRVPVCSLLALIPNKQSSQPVMLRANSRNVKQWRHEVS